MSKKKGKRARGWPPKTPSPALAPLQRRSCATKAAYPTQEAAEVAMYNAVALGFINDDVSNLQVYGPCQFCRSWHVGHKPGTKRNAFIPEADIQAWVQKFYGNTEGEP